ncbi:MAG: putative ABC transporter permease [Oscillospiraceae bacterium]
MEYSFLEICAMFFIYAFLGWCTEVAFAAVNTGGFVNRGFLNGPVCPIYGFGLVIVVLCLTSVEHNALLLFGGAFFLTSALEYITGFSLEKIFHSRWWDYSDMPFNLGGYVCLKFSLIWGLACLLVMKILHPAILLFIGFIPLVLLHVLVGLSTVGIITDATVTIIGIHKLNARLNMLTRLTAELRDLSDGMGEVISENVLAAKGKLEGAKDAIEEAKDVLEEKKDELEEKHRHIAEISAEKREQIRALLAERNRMDFRIIHAFPNMKWSLNQEALDRLRARYMKK